MGCPLVHNYSQVQTVGGEERYFLSMFLTSRCKYCDGSIFKISESALKSAGTSFLTWFILSISVKDCRSNVLFATASIKSKPFLLVTWIYPATLVNLLRSSSQWRYCFGM